MGVLSRNFFILTLAVILEACGALRGGAVSRGPEYKYERVPPEVEAREAISGMPLEFNIPSTENRQPWERAELFFRQFLEIERPSVTFDRATGHAKVSGIPPEGNYRFEVERLDQGNKFFYQVRCTPITSTGTYKIAIQNAQNLARFVRDAQFEGSLLVK